MKNQTRVLVVLALLGASFVITGCPRHFRPHVPHPHRLPHPLQPVDSMLQIDGQNNVAVLSLVAAEKPAAPATAMDGGSAGNAGAVFRPTAMDGGSAGREAVSE